MLSRYPQFNFIFKTLNDRGHAASMNIIVEEFMKFKNHSVSGASRYLLYLEDDWAVFDELYAEDSFKAAINQLNSTLSLSTSVLNWKHPFTAVLTTAVLLLDHHRNCHENCTKIHQILFNEQSRRSCSIGNLANCNLSDLGFGGWPLLTQISVKTTTVEIPFSLHEFGVLDSSFDSRSHEFNNWPGLSLNPGITSLKRVSFLLTSCFTFN